MMTKVAEEAQGEHLNKNDLPDGSESCNVTVEYPASATGAIIGSRGAKIAEVRAQSGAKVQVEKQENCCKVLLAGTEEAVERAKKLVKKLVEEGQERARHGGHGRGGSAQNVDVPRSLVGRVIGKGGETIQRIQKESGARIDVDT